MTTAEVKKAAQARIPIICNGLQYARIQEVGMHYSSAEEVERGKPPEYVYCILIDYSNHSITRALPGELTLVGDAQ